MSRRQVSIRINGKQAEAELNKLAAAKERVYDKLAKLDTAAEDYVEQNKEFGKELNTINRLMKTQQKELGSTKSSYSRLTGGLKSYLKVAAGAFAVDQIIAAGTELFNTASQMELLGKKAKTVFGQQLPQVTYEAERNAEAMGLTVSSYTDAAAAIGDLLIPMKFSREEAASMSTNLVNLSGALSEWTGGQRTAAEVSEILSKAMLGEREQLKTLGISIQEADVKNRLLEKGLQDLTGEHLQQAKAIATVELIMEKSVDAQNAYATNTDSLVRRQAQLSARFTEVKEQLATALIPVFNRLLTIAEAVGRGLGSVGDFLGSLTGANNSATKSISRLQTEFNLEIETLKRGNLSQENRARLIKDINDKYGQYLPNLIKETDNLDAITTAQTKANAAFRERIILVAAEERLTDTAKRQLKAKQEELELQRQLTEAIQESDRATELAAQRGLSRNTVEFGDSRENNAVQQLSGVQTAIRNNIQLQKELQGEYDESINAAQELGLNISKILGGGESPDPPSLTGGSGQTEKETNELLKRSEQLKEVLEKYRREAELAQMTEGDRKIAILKDQYNKEIEVAKALEVEGFPGATEQRLELERLRNAAVEELKDELAAENFAKLEERLDKEFEEEQRLITEQLEKKREAEALIKETTDEVLKTDQELALENLRIYYDDLLLLAERHGIDKQQILDAYEKEFTRITKEGQQERKDNEAKTLADQAKETEARFSAMATVATSAYEAITAAGLEASAVGKVIALAQIGANSARAISAAIAAGAGQTFPANLIAIASGVAAVVSGIAQATSVLNSSPSVPQRYTGGWWNVTGEDDGRQYNAQYIGAQSTGFLPDRPVLLASERGKEFLVSNDTLQIPQAMDHVRALENIQRYGVSSTPVPQFAEGGFTDSRSSDAGTTPPAPASSGSDQVLTQLSPLLAQLTAVLNRMVSEGVPAVIGDRALLDGRERTSELLDAGGGVG